MSQNEVLRDNTVALWEFGYAGRQYRITFVDGQPKLEEWMHGTWYIARIVSLDAAVLLHAATSSLAGGVRFQLDRAKAEINLGERTRNRAHVERWRKVARELEHRLSQMPPPWNGQERPRR